MDRIVVLNMGQNLKLVLLAACFTNLVYEASPARLIMSFPTEDSGTKDLDANHPWWKPKRIPEYLTYNPSSHNSTNDTNSNSSALTPTVPEEETVTEVTPKRNCTKIFNNGNIRPAQPPLVSNDVIQFTKYQQPEPKNPEGIRFPVTGGARAASSPKNNKFSNVIKPRFDNQDYVKNLFRWMNVH